MEGGLEIIGLLALLIAVCELVSRLFPRRVADEFRDAFGDVPAHPQMTNHLQNPCPWPIVDREVERLRDRGAL